MKRVILLKHPPINKRFLAINLFGFILSRRPLNAVELNHERIHTQQQIELLFVFFFLWYSAEWLFYFIKLRNSMEAYRHIRFEREAYRHQAEPDYLKRRRRYRYSQ
ncbi:MAG: hypothetical protein IJ553_03965 [Alloprevotella sp.]|nr:hypothetical protein [Alloprevotella sp.]